MNGIGSSNLNNLNLFISEERAVVTHLSNVLGSRINAGTGRYIHLTSLATFFLKFHLKIFTIYIQTNLYFYTHTNIQSPSPHLSATYLEKWARHEPNPLLRDVFGKMQDINIAFDEIFRVYAQDHLRYRDVFKTVMQEERALDISRKNFESCSSKVVKATKNMEVARKKPCSAKQLTELESDLATSQWLAAQAEKSLMQNTIEHEERKFKLLTNATRMIAETHTRFAATVTELFTGSQVKRTPYLDHQHE